MPPDDAPIHDAIVLTGGRSRRMGRFDKTEALLGDRSLLEHVLAAVPDAVATVVVGPPRSTRRPVTWAIESPPGGGPVAGIGAALPHLTCATVVLLAGDLPFIAPAVPVLLTAVAGAAHCDAAVVADADGRLNYLAAAWSTAALRARLVTLGDLSGVSMRRLYDGARIEVVPDTGSWGADCDTPDDLSAARRRAADGRTR